MLTPIPTVAHRPRIAAVLPRYGKSLGGGAETLMRELILALKNADAIASAEVWTTCANDHRTWANAHPAGVTIEDGMRVHRFPVDERDLETFIGAELGIASGRPLTIDEQLDWLASGVNSAALYRHIAAHESEVDLMLFAPYLFPTSFWGPLIAPEKSLLVPCLHNEPYAYLSVFSHVFRAVRGCLFNALPEQSLASEIFSTASIEEKSGVVGMGFELPNVEPLLEPVRSRPYLLYSGRKERGKNLDLLLEWFAATRTELGDVDLVLIGSGTVDFLEQLPEGVYDLGFVSEDEKLHLMRGAVALCQLSLNESFSIVMMEAWAQEVPIVVHAHGAVPRHHVVKSGGGLYAGSSTEFSVVVRRLLTDEKLRKACGIAGRRYVAAEYSWEAVLGRWQSALSQIDAFHGVTQSASAAAGGDVAA